MGVVSINRRLAALEARERLPSDFDLDALSFDELEQFEPLAARLHAGEEMENWSGAEVAFVQTILAKCRRAA